MQRPYLANWALPRDTVTAMTNILSGSLGKASNSRPTTGSGGSSATLTNLRMVTSLRPLSSKHTANRRPSLERREGGGKGFSPTRYSAEGAVLLVGWLTMCPLGCCPSTQPLTFAAMRLTQ